MSSAWLAGTIKDLDVGNSTPGLDDSVVFFVIVNWDAFVDKISDLVDELFELLQDGFFVLLSKSDFFVEFLALGDFVLGTFSKSRGIIGTAQGSSLFFFFLSAISLLTAFLSFLNWSLMNLSRK